VDENTSQAASVEFVRQWRTNYARSRLQKIGGKARRGFSTSSSSRQETAGSFAVPFGSALRGCLQTAQEFSQIKRAFVSSDKVIPAGLTLIPDYGMFSFAKWGVFYTFWLKHG